MTLDVRRLGRVDYAATRSLQHDLVAQRARGEIVDTLLLCEHPPVITLGRGTDPADVLDRRFPVVEVERGGEATFHGPGQLVGYYVRRLAPENRDLRAHLKLIEETLIAALVDFSVTGFRIAGATGVWVAQDGAQRKIASLGVAARQWVTYHGFALNVSTDLTAFSALNPCGFAASLMTSLSEVLGSPAALESVLDAVEAAARRRFSLD